MHVIIDSNVLIRNPDYRADKWRHFVACCNLAADTCIHIPAVVQNEVRRHITESLDEKLTGASSTLSRVAGVYSGVAAQRAPLIGWGWLKESALKQLDRLIAAVHAKVTPHPSVSHADICDRLFRRDPPFRGQDASGYRDYLIWCNVVDIAKATTGPVFLVTQNLQDFPEAELREHAQQASVNPSSLRVLSSLDEVPFDPAVTVRARDLMQRADSAARGLLSMIENADIIAAAGIPEWATAPPSTFRVTQVLAPGSGYVLGVDTTNPKEPCLLSDGYWIMSYRLAGKAALPEALVLAKALGSRASRLAFDESLGFWNISGTAGIHLSLRSRADVSSIPYCTKLPGDDWG